MGSVSAAHKAAGHNALRRSGPGQKPAFDNALALVGCPDRRIDRLCITCCSPSQPSHRAGFRRDKPIRSILDDEARTPTISVRHLAIICIGCVRLKNDRLAIRRSLETASTGHAGKLWDVEWLFPLQSALG